MMHSIRLKLTLAFVLVSLTAVLLVGGIAREVMIRSISTAGIEVAFTQFKDDVAAYISTYGSWQAAVNVEPFGKFERRRRAIETFTGLRPLQNSGCIEELQQVSDITLDDIEKSDIPINDRIKPPFMFLLLDLQGGTLIPKEKSPPRNWSQIADPITVNGQVMAYAIMDKTPNLNTFDQGYLRAINQSLGIGLLSAASLASCLGWLLANRLTRSIVKLTRAIQGMQKGNLRQQVPVSSIDEIGVLSRAFNAMSQDLAGVYESLEQSHRQLKELSIRDDLTQLYNRRFFNEQAPQLLAMAHRYKHPLSVMIGDIDYFKRVNDNFSHATGDRVLQTIARILANHTRKADLVARYGGEEFVIVFPETDLKAAARRCDRLRRLIEGYAWSEIHPGLKVTISMGLNGDIELDSIDQMLVAADENLYEAKRLGRNQVIAA